MGSKSAGLESVPIWYLGTCKARTLATSLLCRALIFLNLAKDVLILSLKIQYFHCLQYCLIYSLFISSPIFISNFLVLPLGFFVFLIFLVL